MPTLSGNQDCPLASDQLHFGIVLISRLAREPRVELVMRVAVALVRGDEVPDSHRREVLEAMNQRMGSRYCLETLDEADLALLRHDTAWGYAVGGLLTLEEKLDRALTLLAAYFEVRAAEAPKEPPEDTV